jgi:hypothetical protein
LNTLKQAEWEPNRPLLIFFDQFENVFSYQDLTREFRDLALGIQEVSQPVTVGFAWKTDLVGWTESHPYRLRDEIRKEAVVATLPPLGPTDVETLLRRLDKTLGRKLVPTLRQRLREYSQGFPWLFKKLAGHVLREVQGGVTQEELLTEALNVQNLFEADLAELQPAEQEGLRQIARYAPVAVSEVMDMVPPPIVQSLVNRRLIIQVGEKLDTYWDIFRDFLLNGRVPIEESYIVRSAPTSVGRMLREVVSRGGDASVPALARALNTSEGFIFNLSRDLRLFGVLAHEPNRVKLVDDVWEARNREDALRKRVGHALRRHRALSLLAKLADRGEGFLTLNEFARVLPGAFPAVAAKDKTWFMYARSFCQWFDYAGLIGLENQTVMFMENAFVERALLTGGPGVRSRRSFPGQAPGPSLDLVKEIAKEGTVLVGGGPARVDRAARELERLGVIDVGENGEARLRTPGIVDSEGQINQGVLEELLNKVPGGHEAMEVLRTDPRTSAQDVGEILRREQRASWGPSTTQWIGKNFRGWAREAGIVLGSRRGQPSAHGRLEMDSLFPDMDPTR